MTASAIYEGTVRHRRFAVRGHEFTYPVTLAYVDLDELPGLLGGRVARRFRRRAYLGDPGAPLADSVRRRVQAEIGIVPAGPIRLLTMLQRYGTTFNPVSFYYCFDRSERLEAIAAEVTSTPWGERHSYVLEADAGQVLRGAFDKRLHVSPFMGMEQTYDWRMAVPGETLSVHIASQEHGRPAFDATLNLRRQPLTRSSLRSVTSPARVLALIYGQALALRLKGVPVHPHPGVPAA